MHKRAPDRYNHVIPVGDGGLGLVARHSWGPAIASGGYRLVDRPAVVPGWTSVQEYFVLPSGDKPELLLPAVRGPALARMLRAYLGLRTPRAQAARTAKALLAQLGVPASQTTIALQQSHTGQGAGTEPLTNISAQLGVHLHAALGVRRGANGKATMHLFSDSGVPLGLAKLSWNTLTRAYVENEIAVLRELAGKAGPVHVPGLLATGRMHSDHYLVAAPLPKSVRQPTRATPLTTTELTTIFPVIGSSPVAHIPQMQRLAARLETYEPEITSSVRTLLNTLLASVMSQPLELRVARRWHGDLVPWNTGRDAQGRVWVWDWETSEPDAVAGLDQTHWHVNLSGAQRGAAIHQRLQDSLPALNPVLQSLGYGPRQRHLLAGVYALVTAERAIGLANANGGWSRVRVDERQTTDLLALGLELVRRSASRP